KTLPEGADPRRVERENRRWRAKLGLPDEAFTPGTPADMALDPQHVQQAVQALQEETHPAPAQNAAAPNAAQNQIYGIDAKLKADADLRDGQRLELLEQREVLDLQLRLLTEHANALDGSSQLPSGLAQAVQVSAQAVEAAAQSAADGAQLRGIWDE